MVDRARTVPCRAHSTSPASAHRTDLAGAALGMDKLAFAAVCLGADSRTSLSRSPST